MRVSSIARLYRVRLRARLVQELFAVLGIAIGVALLFASQVANSSLNGSVEQLTNGVVGRMSFQLTARDSAGFPEGLLAQVALLPGVHAAIPVLEQSANVVGPGGQQSVDLVGTDPRLARLGGRLVRHVGALALAGRARILLLPAPVAQRLGASSVQPVKLQIGADQTAALLVPQLLSGDAGALGRTPIAVAPLRTVQQLSAMRGRLTSIFVQSPPARGREVQAGLLRLAAGILTVRPADFNSALFRRAAAPVNQSTALFSAISALVGFLFAFNALLLSVPQRRSLIEDLRLDGYTRRMIVQVLLFDALVLGAVASLAGLALGQLLSVALFNSDPGYLSFAFAIGAQRIVTWQSVALAVGGGLLAACVGVLAPLRGEIFAELGGFFRASLGRTAARPWRLLGAAGVCLAATTAILLAAPRAAVVAVVCLTAALLLALPAALELAVSLFDRAQARLTGAAAHLAVIELRSRANQARSIAIAATGAIAVFGSVAIQGARENLQRGLDASARGVDSLADVWVSPAGASNSFATTRFSASAGPAATSTSTSTSTPSAFAALGAAPRAAPRSPALSGSAAGPRLARPSALPAALARLPGVRAVSVYRGSFLDWGDRRLWVVAPPRAAARPIAPSQILSGDARLAEARLRGSGWAVVSQALATEHHLHVGSTFTLPSPRPARFRVAALSSNLGWAPGALVLNADDYARAWGSADPSAYLLSLAPGASPAGVAAQVRRVLGSRSGLAVQTAAQRERLHYAQAAQGLSRLSEIRTLVLIAGVLAMAAAMGAMIWQRRVRLADMKVDGFSRDALWRALLWESGVLLGAGCSLGALLGLYGQLLLSRALVVVSGFPVIGSVGVPAALISFALITAVAVAIVAVPGHLAARVRPSVSLQE